MLPYATEANVVKIVNEKLKEQSGGSTPSKDEIVTIVNEAIENGDISIPSGVISHEEMQEVLEKLYDMDSNNKYGQPYISYFEANSFNSFINNLPDALDVCGTISMMIAEKNLLVFINDSKLVCEWEEEGSITKDVVKDTDGNKIFSIDTDTDIEIGGTTLVVYEACKEPLKFEVVEFPSQE